MNKSWIEISKKNLFHNFNQFKKLGNFKIASVVKANAYGHGLKEVAGILKGKTDFFAVDNLEEALELRKMDKETPVLILGYTTKNSLEEAIENDISFVVYDKNALSKISKLTLNKKAKLHVKVETGLNRQGIKGAEFLSLIKKIHKNKNMVVEGVSMHFANVEDTLDRSFAKEQLGVFKKNINSQKAFLKGVVKHSSGSAAAFVFPKSRMDMVRAGISLYGLWPSSETKLSLKLDKKNFNLKPVMTFKSIIAQVKQIEAGESVGYGRTWFAPRKSKIAVIPVGYSDGYDRKLSNSGRVIIRSSYAPVVGRVAMNMITVDVTDIKSVKQEDEVILLGKDKKLEVSAEELAEKIGTINYEVVSRINPLIKRIVV